MTETKPMICPHCKIPMNHHGDKPMEPRTDEEAKRCLPGLGLFVEEIHTCGRCGCVLSRPATISA